MACLAVGLGLCLADVLVLVGHGLLDVAQARAAGVLLTLLVSALAAGFVAGLGGCLLSWLHQRPRLRWIGPSCLAAAVAWRGLQLFSGERVARWSFVAALRLGWVVCSALIVLLAWRWLRARLASPAGRVTILAAGLPMAGALALADLFLLTGLYPALHDLLALALLTLLGVCGASLAVSLPPRWSRSLGLLGQGLGASSCLLVVTGVLPPGDLVVRNLVLEDAPYASRVLGPLASEQGSVDEALRVRARLLLRSPAALPQAVLDRTLQGRRSWNVLLVTIDTLRPDRMGCYGYGRDTTPAIDRIAAQSVVFEAAYSQYPASPLAMASYLQGQYPLRVREQVFPVEPRLEDAPQALPQDLHGAGWRTAAVFALDGGRVARSFAYAPRGFESFDAPSEAGSEWPAEEVVPRALSHLDGKRPWFLWVHLIDPHGPYLQHAHARFGDSSSDLYDGEIAHADRHLGVLLDALRARRELERTVIIIHSDHGEEFREHGHLFHGTTLHEEQVRVPLIIRIPGVRPRRVARPVELVDLRTTCLRLLGVRGAPDAGDSLLPLLLPEQARLAGVEPPTGIAYMQLPTARSLRLHALRYGRYKLIHSPARGTLRVYDVQRDPTEQRPLDPEQVEDLPLLRALLAVLREESLARAGPERPPGSGVARAQGLLGAGRLTEARLLLLSTLREDPGSSLGLQALRQLALVPDATVENPLLEVLERASGGTRAGVALALAGLEGEDSRQALAGLARDADADVRLAARVSLAVRGHAAAGPSLATIAEQVRGRRRVLALIGAGSLREGPAAGLPRSMALQLDLDDWQRFLVLRGSTARRNPRACLGLVDLLARGVVRPWEDVMAAHALRILPEWLSLPALDWGLLHESGWQLEGARSWLAERGDLRRETVVRGLQDARMAAVGRLTTDPAGAAAQLLEAIADAGSKGVRDVTAVTLAWRLLLAAGRPAEAARAMHRLVRRDAGQDQGLKTFATRLARLAESLGRAPAGRLSVLLRDTPPDPREGLFAVLARLQLAPSSGGLQGGLTPAAARVRAVLRAAGDGRVLAETWAPLPLDGLLPGESQAVLLTLPLDALGEQTWRLELSVKGAAVPGLVVTPGR